MAVVEVLHSVEVLEVCYITCDLTKSLRYVQIQHHILSITLSKEDNVQKKGVGPWDTRLENDFKHIVLSLNFSKFGNMILIPRK